MNETIEKELWSELEKSSIKFQSKLDSKYKRNNGIYYTGLELADKIIKNLFENTKIKEPVWKNTFFEPCGGVGNFIFAYLKYIYSNYKLTEEEARILIKNIYYCELDFNAKELYVSNIKKLTKIFFNIEIEEDDLNIGESLVYNLNQEKVEYIDVNKYFGKDKFDIIVTNPPYKSLRAEKRNYDFETDFMADKVKYEEIKKQASERYSLSKQVSSNIFKYFVEEILLNYSNENSNIGILIPSSILTDKSCEGLRKEILEKNGLRVICNIPETNKYIKAQQSLTYLIIEKSKKTNKVRISDLKNKDIIIDVKDFVNKDHGYSMMVLKEEEYTLLNKMMSFKKLKEFECIVNMRGELDLTLNKSDIISAKTEYKLVKGRNIDRYELLDCNNGFVTNEFVKKSPKKYYIENERIACQQIVNVNKERRLMFTFMPCNYVLGNSCNFIYVKENKKGIDIYYLLGLLNSKLLNWYFKLFSSNNHVNNYELDNLPIPIHDIAKMKQVSEIAFKNSQEYSKLNDEKIDDLVNELFGLENISKTKMNAELNTNKEDYEKHMNNKPIYEQLSIFSKFRSELDNKVDEVTKLKQKYITNNFVINNKSYKMSDLDMEIITSVPAGGNWQNIPQETMNKSKRLLGIQKTGGRTTLYGRLQYDKPSYTITTYFNRPGNGCYIHPVNNRVLTTREAARLQCFPDDYYFYGNQKDILNQIGNAVPPVIGYLIGEKIIKSLGCGISLDLFSGAGGLLYGMKKAGITHALANDFDKSACVTLKVNNPEIEVLYGDITKEAVKTEIINKGIYKNTDIICGGPPCQGFSLAGFRRSDDPRNKLFRDFYDVVKSVKPKVFVFENVIGILSYKKGKTYEEIKTLFKELGYNVHGEALMFNEYGVPQKRKRVIVIGVRNDLNISPESLYPDKITESKETQITVKDAIGDLEKIELNKNVIIPKSESEFQRFIKNHISYEEYVLNLSSKNKRGQI
ncbi:TPA: Alw26I/Eco31I/Esp3I family type II restriction adenine-specific DNA-methyltransferase [Clostridioides difficile]|uniref:Cytosine-specific methyltransferase n=1 Tax=Clostridium liquoris TaxID=1289519 RepID=A0A2T0B5T4_9CLOT|nr:Alw26I/Eco31I/Esp3I family type II restriction adenine-specific DNA-methyltransferase [Clostridium liquoris]PRR79261.1 Modification methylase HaeIII [Clostridium liquoris]